MTARGLRLATCGLVLSLACDSGDKPAPARLWTTEDLQAAARLSKPVGTTGLLASDFVTLRGQTLPLLSPPYADAPAVQAAGFDGLNVVPAFSEGHTASYATTEVWQGFPAVWLQPLYAFVTGVDGGAPNFTGAPAVFSIGTRSRFYSPYWQVIYVTVPKGDKTVYTSARQVLDSGLPLTEGAGTLCVLAPGDIQLAQAAGAATPVSPLFNDPVTVNTSRPGYVDGEAVNYLDFGRFRFNWHSPDNTIDEAALLDLSVRAPDGSLASLGLPKVGGTGPLFSNTPARVINGKPMFGSLWHLYRVLLQPGSGVFIPSTRPALRAAVSAAATKAGLPPTNTFVAPIAPQNEQIAGADKLLLRVAVNASCFLDTVNFPASCRWLDSQAAVEREIPGPYFVDTELYQTCPFLTWNDVMVNP